MARFKNIGEAPVHVFSPAGFPSSFLAEPDQIIEVPGEVAEETDDAYILGEDGHARAWPKAQWLVTSKADHTPPAITNEEN